MTVAVDQAGVGTPDDLVRASDDLAVYEIERRFPAYSEKVPQAAVDYVASLVKVDPCLVAKYSWTGRTIKNHRKQAWAVIMSALR